MTARTLSKGKIITATIKLINQQKQPTFSNLGKELGTRSQSIYNYFSDGDALKAAVSADFYNVLADKLQEELFGLTSKTAITKFCEVYNDYAQQRFLVTQYVISTPKWMFHGDKDVEASNERIFVMLRALVDPLTKHKKQAIVIGRMLRNLITGQAIHVGSGRFQNRLVTPDESYYQMIDLVLSTLED